jgi:hypothetical protein
MPNPLSSGKAALNAYQASSLMELQFLLQEYFECYNGWKMLFLIPNKVKSKK